MCSTRFVADHPICLAMVLGPGSFNTGAVQECAPFSPSTSITVYGTAYQCNAQISDLIASCGIDSCFLPGSGDDGHPRKSYQGWGFDVPMYPLAAFNSRFPGFGIYSLTVSSLLFFGKLSAFTPSTADHCHDIGPFFPSGPPSDTQAERLVSTSDLPDKTAVIMPSSIYDHKDGPCKIFWIFLCVH
ncbi:hypothetical protein P692DRAFT_20811806 [Suillus brevipes Sb2]|nr:hypothetical protein P692DRAFT_20811806 [Suillus brevipes Sb2]